MGDYKQHLCRFAVHDDALLEAIAVDGSSFASSGIDERTAALVTVAATIAVDAAPASSPAPRPQGRLRWETLRTQTEERRRRRRHAD